MKETCHLSLFWYIGTCLISVVNLVLIFKALKSHSKLDVCAIKYLSCRRLLNFACSIRVTVAKVKQGMRSQSKNEYQISETIL